MTNETPHKHVYHLRTFPIPSRGQMGFLQGTDGFWCACGKRRPLNAASPAEQVKAALRADRDRNRRRDKP